MWPHILRPLSGESLRRKFARTRDRVVCVEASVFYLRLELPLPRFSGFHVSSRTALPNGTFLRPYRHSKMILASRFAT